MMSYWRSMRQQRRLGLRILTALVAGTVLVWTLALIRDALAGR